MDLYCTSARNTCVLHRFFAIHKSRSYCPFTFRYILSYSWMFCLFYLCILSGECILNCCGRYSYFFSPTTRQPLVGQGLLIIEARRSHLDTALSVGLPWASDQPDVDTSIWQHTTLTRDRNTCLRRHSNLQSQQASGHRPTTQTARPLDIHSTYANVPNSKRQYLSWWN